MTRWITVVIVTTIIVRGVLAEETQLEPLIVQSDSGQRGGHVNLEALPARGSNNSLRKVLTVESLEHIQSAQLLIYGALRDPTDQDSFTFDSWEWIFFSLNGHEWVVHVEDVPMLHKSLFEVNWDDVYWASIKIPDVSYLKEGVNELVIWNNNPLDHRKNKYLVVAYDNSGSASNSSSLVEGEWSNKDLNGDREDAPQGEWMVRLKLNRLNHDQQKTVDALGPARYRKAVDEKKEFVWGFTDAAHWVFPDRPYTEPLENTWTIDAARNEYESCQFVMVPVSTEIRMAEVFASDFQAEDDAVISRDAVVVRLVRTARAEGVDWPDPLPPAFPVDLPRGIVQAYWITVHVPPDAAAGTYKSELIVTSMSTGGRDGNLEKIEFKLRVRDFMLPTVSHYQMVASTNRAQHQWKIGNKKSNGFNPSPRIYLDQQGDLQLDFANFDRQMEVDLATGIDSFCLGLSYTGAGRFAPWTFDWRVPVEGKDTNQRIWVNPVEMDDLGADKPNSKQARKWFKQMLSQFYDHLEDMGWTQYFWVYAADEPQGSDLVEPLKRYLQIIDEVAPKLRIMITIGPTDAFGPKLDIACIMMNHMREDTAETAAALNQELWCYSCGHLNNPALTINQTPVAIRLWFWLQHKWNVTRTLLWHTNVYARNFLSPGADGRGDGQVFWSRHSPDGREETVIPSIRVEMLRDGVEDREYLYKLSQLVQDFEDVADRVEEKTLLVRAQELAIVPSELVNTQFDLSRDVDKLLNRRTEIADTVELLTDATR